MRKLLFVLTLGSIFQYCAPPALENTANSTYFDVDSLVSHQVKVLAAKNQKATKTVAIDGKEESMEIKPDQDQWRKELIGLLDFDIKKSRYLGAFDIEKNATKDSYQLKGKEKAPIKSLTIEKGENGMVTKLTGKIQDDEASMVYTTCQVYEVRFTGGLLTTVNLKGYQKMVMKDTVFYEVNIEVNQ